MRHQVKKTGIPKHILRNLAVSVLLYEKVNTSKTKAKAVRSVIDRMISKAKSKDTSNAIRYLKSYLPDMLAVRKIIDVLVKRYQNRTSGYTRIIPALTRKGDAAEIVTILLTH